MMKTSRKGMLSAVLTAVLVCPAGLRATTTQRVASGLDRPTHVTAPPGDSGRLFITEQPGRVRIVKGGTLLSVPFLDITDRVNDNRTERGLFSVAFHPNYDSNGYFYVNYTDAGGGTVVERYTVSADSDVADVGSAFVILTVGQPFNNHNGGQLCFGPEDGYLYIGMGDGGSGGDPDNRAQNLGDLLGKLLRIDVDGGSPYAIPATNPFVGASGGRPEVFAFGLRNPYRFSFDRQAGDLYLADVGQNRYEEVNYRPAADIGGENYGWRILEGFHCFNPLFGCNSSGLTPPIHEYSLSGSRCSVIGGFVYRGVALEGMQGVYFFADYCSGQIWSFRVVGGQVTDFQERTAELAPGGGLDMALISSFGEDADGEIYLCDHRDGEVFKIVPGQSTGGGGGTTGVGSQPLCGELCGSGVVPGVVFCVSALFGAQRIRRRRY